MSSKTNTKEKKPRKKKDPNAPKKSLSSYMYFTIETRPQIKKDFPTLSFGDIAKKLGEMWKSLDAKDKVSYEEKAAKDKERYIDQKKLYDENNKGK